MKASLLIGTVLVVSAIGITTSPSQTSAQLRLQETPALAGWGHVFKDVQVRFDTGVGTTSTTTSLTKGEVYPKTGSAWFWGIYVDKPIISTFLDIGYDLEWWEREVLPRDTLEREFFDTIRLVAHYRQGEFFVAGDPRRDEFYLGGRIVIDLGRFARHIPFFQR